MNIIGLWKITDMNAFDKSFKQTWRKADELLADENVPPMQKAMAQAVFLFREDGKSLQLMPKEVTGGEGEPYDDKFVIGHIADWKEEGGKLFIAAEENGENDWQEIVPEGDSYIMFNMFKIAKA